jgi:thiol-disulfide isomerase/thioredoxin
MALRPNLPVRRWALPLLCALVTVPTVALAGEPAPAAKGSPARHAPPWLGVQMGDAGGGVLVRHVLRGSPAEKAGLRDGDVILTVERAAVAKPTDVSSAVAQRAPGDALALTLRRGGQTIPLTARLEARPSAEETLTRDLVGSAAPAWVDTTPLAGAPASIDALRGKVVVLDFWASFCGPCRYMAPELSALSARYQAQGLAVVGITTDAPEVAASTRESWGMRYGVVTDRNASTHQGYGITALPTIFIIDRRGIVRAVTVGAGRGEVDRLEALVMTLLAEAPPP